MENKANRTLSIVFFILAFATFILDAFSKEDLNVIFWALLIISNVYNANTKEPCEK